METRLHRAELETESRARRLTREALDVPEDDHLAERRLERGDRRVDTRDEFEPLEGAVRRIGGRDLRRDRVRFDAVAEGSPLTCEPTEHPRARVPNHGVEPRERARTRDDVRAPRELHERLLHRVVGVEAVATGAEAEPVDAVMVRSYQLGERLVVSKRGGGRGPHDPATGQVDRPMRR